MERCSAYRILKEIELLDTRIDVKQSEVTALRERATSVTQTISEVRVVTSCPEGKMSRAVDRLVDLQAEINDDIDRLVDYKRKVQKVLDKMGNPDYIRVLYKRYFERKPWKKIAEEMNVESRTAQRYEEQALPLFMRLWEEADGDGI